MDNHLERLTAMCEPSQVTWDLSDLDMAAIRWAVAKLTPKPRQAAKKHAFSASDMAVAKWMWALILKLQPSRKPPSFESWANEIRLMVEMDGRTHDDIERLFALVQADDFWRTNVLSPSKLRDKWDDLSLQLPRKPAHGRQEAGRVRDRDFATTYGDRYARHTTDPTQPPAPPAHASRYVTGR